MVDFRIGLMGATLAAALGACAGAGLGQAVRGDIEKQMASAQPMITACYRSALQRNRKLAGRMMVRIKTDPKSGHFTRARVVETQLPDTALEQCVIETVAALTLEQPTKTSVEANFPLDFAPLN